MKIDYPLIAASDIRVGDTVLLKVPEAHGPISYYEYTVEDLPVRSEGVYYLVERPQEKFPDRYGAVIIAKKVRGIYFPEGIAMTRQRGSSYGHTGVLWKSIGTKITGADNHSEKHIEDWVLAQIVPVEENK